MNFPNITCKIEMFVSINPSEDPEKIKNSISNIFPLSEIKIENFSVSAVSDKIESLEKIKETIHSKKSQNIYRKYLEKHLNQDTTWFYLNKQAAFVGKIAICEEAGESPMGPIKVILTSRNFDRIINWLVFRNNEN